MQSIKSQSQTADVNYQLSQMLAVGGGLEKVAMETLPPFIRETRDYASFARKILFVHDVTADELQTIGEESYVYYSKDFQSHAAFYGDNPEIPRLQIEGSGVNVAIMTIASDDSTINLKKLMTQKFNYLERVRELSGQAISKLEDNKLISLVETLLKGNSADLAVPQYAGQIVTSSDTELSKAHLVELKKTLSQHDVPLAAFVMKTSTIDDILKWSESEVDDVTMRELLEVGVKYTIWGAVKLIPSIILASTVIYAFSEPQFVGMMPVLKDLTVTLTETPNKLEKGLFLFEFVGMYLASHKAVGKLILGYTSGAKIAIPASDASVAGSIVGNGVGSVL